MQRRLFALLSVYSGLFALDEKLLMTHTHCRKCGLTATSAILLLKAEQQPHEIHKFLKSIGRNDMHIRLFGSLRDALKRFGFKELVRYIRTAKKEGVGIF